MIRFGVRDGRQVWRNDETSRDSTWDSLHGEVEVFDKQGWHLGALHPQTGDLLKEAEKTRRLKL
jgi:hypothetical protein